MTTWLCVDVSVGSCGHTAVWREGSTFSTRDSLIKVTLTRSTLEGTHLPFSVDMNIANAGPINSRTSANPRESQKVFIQRGLPSRGFIHPESNDLSGWEGFHAREPVRVTNRRACILLAVRSTVRATLALSITRSLTRGARKVDKMLRGHG